MGKEGDLIEAGRNGDISAIEKLLACKDRPRKVPGFAPLGFSFSSLRRTVNANAQNSEGDTSLHLAALNGHLESVRLLLKHDASANLMDASGCFPLHLAAWSGNAEICRTLLNQGPSLAKVNEQNASGDTALHNAAQYGHTETVKALLENFADPLIRNQSAETALDLAAQYGRLDCVRLLLNNCPALVDCSTVNSSALHLASRNGHKDAVLALLNSGFDVNCVSESGSALHEAARYGKVETVALLLTHGADLTLQDSLGLTALEIVRETKSEAAVEIARLIRLKGETKYASYPRATLLSNDTDTNSLKLIAKREKDSFSSDYATSVRSSEYSSIAESTGSTYSSTGYWRPAETSGDLRTFKSGPGKDPNGNTKNWVEKESDFATYCDVESVERVPAVEEADSDPESNHKIPVYAVVSNRSYTSRTSRTTSADDDSTPAVYDEDLYEAFDPLWRTPGTDQSETPNGSADQSEMNSESPDVDMMETIDVPPVPQKLACLQNNNPEYTTEMNGSENEVPPRRPLMQIGETSDGDYSEVSPVRETAILNGSTDERLTETETEVAEQELPDTPINNDILHRPPSLELAKTPPNELVQPEQLPTPDHPPPSPKTALRGIQLIINPKHKRRSRDMETSTDEIQFARETEAKKRVEPQPLPSTPESDSESGDDDGSGADSDSDVPDGVIEVRTSSHEPYKGLIKGSTPSGKRRAMSAMYDDIVVRSPTKRSSLNITIGGPNQQDELSTMFKEIDDIVGDLKAHKDARLQLRRSDSTPERAPESPLPNGGEAKSRDDSHSEDWAEIADIMASFGGRITRESVFIRDFEEEFTRLITGSSKAQSVGDWLASLSLSQYENILVPNGFDDMDFMANNVLEESDLIEMGIYNEQHRDTMLTALKQLPVMKSIEETETIPSTVEEWLQSLHLEVYLSMFLDRDYVTMEKVKRIWELELTTVLDITTLGHRKRMIASLGLSRPQNSLETMEKVDLSTLSWTLGSEDSGVTFDMHQLTVADAHDAKSRSSSDLRDTTSDLSSDVGTTSSATSTTSSDKSHPKLSSGEPRKLDRAERPVKSELLEPRRRSRKASSEQSDEEEPQVVRRRPKSQPASSRFSFSGIELRPPQDTMQEANNMVVQNWRHKPEELIKGCCYYFAQYLGSTFIRELSEDSTHESIVKLKNVHDNVSKLPLITLAISYRGVKFIEARSKKVICEHEIGNIFCVRQDDENRNFFAYITEDLTSSKHYCHVFSVKTTDLAAEITLTLGEAFEVAYQMSMREKAVEASQEYEDLLLQTEAQIDYALAHH